MTISTHTQSPPSAASGGAPLDAVARIADAAGVGSSCLTERIMSALGGILVPRPDNFTPAERTPWGGTLIRQLKSTLGLPPGGIVGESWEISAHPTFPNLIPIDVEGRHVEVPLSLIGRLAPKMLYGPFNNAQYGDKPPFLTKLLNSGSWTGYRQELRKTLVAAGLESSRHILDGNNHELHRALMNLASAEGATAERLRGIHRAMIARNLSVQIHPDTDYAHRNDAWRAKTEMWIILANERGAGIYIGLAPQACESEMRRALENTEDVSEFLNFVTVAPGDVFFIPAGTPHAIGAGILLLEQQETSETTFRYFSWWDGRPLHVEDAIASTHWDAPRGLDYVDRALRRTPQTVQNGISGTALHEILAVENEFSYDRLTFAVGDIHEGNASGGMQGFTVIEGSVEAAGAHGTPFGPFSAGQSFIVPAHMGRYTISAAHDAVVYIGRSDPRRK